MTQMLRCTGSLLTLLFTLWGKPQLSVHRLRYDQTHGQRHCETWSSIFFSHIKIMPTALHYAILCAPLFHWLHLADLGWIGSSNLTAHWWDQIPKESNGLSGVHRLSSQTSHEQKDAKLTKNLYKICLFATPRDFSDLRSDKFRANNENVRIWCVYSSASSDSSVH